MPVILCLHGAGSSAAIFKFQTSRLRAQLAKDVECVFIEGPVVSGPGPGMMPLFADAGPFYCWFGLSGAKRHQEIEAIKDRLRNTVASIHAGTLDGIKSRDVAGIMAFSQGAVTSTLLLLQQAQGELSWLPTMRFGIMICCDFTSEVMDYVNGTSDGEMLVHVPTLHLHGSKDQYASRSRMMLNTHYNPDLCEVLTFEGGHQLPQNLYDCKQAAERINEVIQKTEVPSKQPQSKEAETIGLDVSVAEVEVGTVT